MNGEGLARGTIQEKERCNDRVEDVDEIEVGSRVEIACPLFCRV